TSGSASARPHAAVPRSRADVAAPLSCPGSPARLRVREPPLQEETRAMGKSRKPATDAARFRVEHDSMGELLVPADALWGAQTQRAVENFPVSGQPMPRGFIRALGLVKAAAATVNGELGLLPAATAKAIHAAAM